jgi:protein-S-isoprenylcysteine O-methyltransferase Ste14
VNGQEIGRVSLIVLLSLLTALRFYFKYRTGVLREAFLPLAEGPFLVGCRLLFGLPLAAGTVVSVFTPQRAPALVLDMPLSLRAAGSFVALLCLLLLAWVQRTLGTNFSTTVFLRTIHRLVTDGPYRRVRHPMYAAYFLFFLSLFFVCGNWLVSTSGMGMILILMTVRLRREEAILVDRFGDAYLSYRDRTGAFVPRHLGPQVRSSTNDRPSTR